ncbi:phosphoserine phosphatase [Coccidioides immitis H538.4]|uniref:phosphoserine phosphatase n=1 Tax=Coccidioides immitis H538.4 TaxID=396776 RepID=A0A0J8UBL3_COCIT|nr:phosphoserine phosphatase [Coccidioides immitis H538.4]
MASNPLPSREGRPVLRHSSLSGGSFILDHQQYKPSPSGPSGFSNLLRSTGNVLTAPLVLNGSPSQGKDARVKESGIVHSIFSNSLSSLPADTPKLVATIFYKASQPVHPHIHPDSSRQPHSLRDLPAPSVPEGSAPTQNVEEFSREPAPQEPEPLDHLYGPLWRISQPPYHGMSSSHRCLDSEDHSRVVEVKFIDEIARFIGVEKEVSEITARAMNGELDFSASLKARVSLLKGVPADVFEKLKSIITIAPGARELCRALKRLGFKMAVLSGGFQPLAEWLAKELSLDYAFANHLVSDDSTQTLSGTLSPNHPIIDATQKRNLLRTIAADNDIQISQTLAVGDGANDLLMLNEAGLGVAWRAKSKVQMEAPTRLNGESLVDILYLMGLSERDIKELIKE